MCGIAGILSQKPIASAELVGICLAFSNGLRHRGPDDEGFIFIRENGEFEILGAEDSRGSLGLKNIHSASGNYIAALVHRRLSIIGLGDAGHQPMCSPSGRYWMVYNGEIFNFKELNNKYGFYSKTGTDTETLLNLLDLKGVYCSEEWDGFFAAIVWDTKEKVFFTFRDSTGVKPLFFNHTKDNVIFCSETAPIRKVSGSISLNPEAVFHHLTEGLTNDGKQNTFFNEIKEIKPGSICSIGIENLRIEQNEIEIPHEKSLDNLRGKLETSISKRLISDVPLGFAVSGGIDSAAIIGIARKILGKEAELKLFSIVSNDKKSDESKWQKKVSDFNQAHWFKAQIEDVSQDVFGEVTRFADMPLVAWNNIAQNELCKLAKQNNITVLFNGQGADEIFGGYPDYLQRDWWKLSEFLKSKSENLPLEYGEIRKGWWKLKVLQYLPNIMRDFLFLNNKKMLLSENLHQYQSLLWKKAGLNADEKMRDDYFGLKLGQMLGWEDRNSMAHSVESRNPFADDKSLSAYLGMSFKEKISNGFTKGVLREVLNDVVPADVLWRKDKKGFTVPEAFMTWKQLEAWEPLFMSSVLDEWSPRAAREAFLGKLYPENEKGLKLFFRFTAMSVFSEQVKNG